MAPQRSSSLPPEGQPQRHTIVLSPRHVFTVFIWASGALLILGIASQLMKYSGGHGTQMGLEGLLNLDQENSVPAWYASSTLLLCALLLGIIGVAKQQGHDRFAGHWLALAAIFTGLSLDEAVSLHEAVGVVVKDHFAPGGYLSFAWVIPGSVFVMLVGLCYARFLAMLPSETRAHFLLAGAVYIGGALGMECVAGKYVSLYGRDQVTYALLVAGEEGLEMVGIALFLYGLSSYIARHLSTLQIRVAAGRLADLSLAQLPAAAPQKARAEHWQKAPLLSR